jgi:hypothetical protein
MQTLKPLNVEKNRLRLWLFFTITALFWVVPERLSVWGGPSRFLGLADVLALAVLVFVFFVLPTVTMPPRLKWRYGLALVILLAIKVGLGLAWQPEGLKARYYANADWAGSPEKSWAFRDVSNTATRRDRQIHFGPKGFSLFEPTFPLYFMNDSRRFNWYGPEKAKRRNPAFSAVWTGRLWVTDNDPGRGILIAADAGTITLNGRIVAKSHLGKPSEFGLTPGIHHIEVRYAHNGNGPRGLTLGWIRDGRTEPIPSSRLFTGEEPPKGNRHLHLATLIIHVFWVLTLVMLVGRRWRQPMRGRVRWERVVVFVILLLLVVVEWGGYLHRAARPHGEILSGGEDWLTYETMARDILSGDLLSRQFTGRKTFYYFPGYRYILAGLHLLMGESVAMVVLAQTIISAAFLAFLYYAGKKLYGVRVGAIAAIIALLCRFGLKYCHGTHLLATVFGVGFSFAGLYFLLWFGRTKRIRHVVAAGIWFGIACAVRGNFLGFLPFAALWVIWQASRRGRILAGLIFLMTAFLPVLPIGIRNFHVAGRFQVTSAHTGPTIWLGNHPEGAQRPPDDQAIHAVINYARTQPYDFAMGFVRRAAYLVGIYWDEGRLGVQLAVLLPTALAILGFWKLRSGPEKAEMTLLLIWIGINLAVLMVANPWYYGWRLVAPTFPAIYLICALFLDALWQSKRRSDIAAPESAAASPGPPPRFGGKFLKRP